MFTREDSQGRCPAVAVDPSLHAHTQMPTHAESATPQVVVVTGASAGLGRAIAVRFARDGARIGLLARGTDGLEGARREVEALGGTALVLPTDVADADAVERAADRVERELGPIDVWINNAMVSVFSPVHLMQAEEYRRVTEVTYLGSVHGILAALRRMRPRDRGTIVQVGSALAYRGIPLQSAYCGAKHATQGFMDSLRAELLHDDSHIRVTSVHMPAMNTPQFTWVRSRLPNEPQPVPPIYQPEVGAEAVYRATRPEFARREWLVAHPTYVAVLGNRLAPALGDHYLASVGYDAQQTDEPVAPDRRDNLWEPVPGDHGAHGPFGARSTDRSPLLWMTTYRRWVALGAAAVLMVAFTVTVQGLAPDGGRSAPAALATLLSCALLFGTWAGWVIGHRNGWRMPNAVVATAVLVLGALGGPLLTFAAAGGEPGPVAFAAAVTIAGLATGLTFWPMGQRQGERQWL